MRAEGPKERPPAGGGRVRVEGAFVALRGFEKTDREILEQELWERCALFTPDIGEAEYVVYAPGQAETQSDWPEALRREAAGECVLLPFPVYRLWLRRSVTAESVRPEDRPCVMAHFLTHGQDWAGSVSGADRAAETLLREEHISLAEAYYTSGDTGTLLSLFDALRAREEAWAKTGFSDGYYTCLLAQRYLARSGKEEKTETTLCLLEYIHSRFTDAHLTAAEKTLSAYTLGEKKRPPIWFSRGAVLTLGAYPQSEGGTGKEPAEWLVLERKEDRALLISRFILERSAYHAERTGITWESCTLRNWLNGPFLNRLFTPAEQEMLIEDTVPAAADRRYQTDPGPATRDRLFLLSAREAERYFGTGSERMAGTTEHTDMPIVHSLRYDVKDGRPTLMWWLRGNSARQELAPYVNGAGEIIESGQFADYVFFGVRPALWIRIR